MKKGEADSVRVLCLDGMSYTELGTVVGEYVCVFGVDDKSMIGETGYVSLLKAVLLNGFLSCSW